MLPEPLEVARGLLLPHRAQIAATTCDDCTGLFAGQGWSQDVFDYYIWYVNAVTLLQARGCGLRH